MAKLWNTPNIHQDVLKSGNLLHRWGFIDSQFGTTVAVESIPNKSKNLGW